MNTKPSEIKENFIDLIANQWMLIAAGNQINHNCMTASWGGVGYLWNKNVVYIFIRLQRYTYNFVNNNLEFSINFFDEKYRDILKTCGAKSGTEINKMKLEITPLFSENCVYYKEAKLSIICKKIYFQDINPDNFTDNSIIKNYPQNDFHRMFIGEIISIIEK